jgi:glycosyltransferase involved in cell wall biosynthesis
MHNHVHPKFSIITVTYNAGAVLEDTIQSVITQTYRNVEYIIVDGGSKDHTLDIINRYREQLNKIGFCYDWSRELKTCDPQWTTVFWRWAATCL